MSQISKGIFASCAVALSLGAVQLAFAHDLIGSRQTAVAAPETGINRGSKSDRASVPGSSVQTRTIALRLQGLSDTSVLVRIPVASEETKAMRKETRNGPAPATQVPARKIAVACEPPVSVLTDVAKLLQPGRCVT